MKDEYQLIFSAKALLDLKDAKHWYELQQKGLGKRLAADIKNLLIKISDNPYFASIRFENIRAPFCKSFPYSIHYEIDDVKKQVKVISIFHHSRRPYWHYDGNETE